MKNTENRRYEMLLRADEFGGAHHDVFPESSPAGQAFAGLSGVVKQLGQQAVSKLSAAREGRRKKDAAREAVLDRLETISRCARVIARETAGFGEEFQLGRTRSNQSILTTGRLFAQEAPKFQAQFVASGMPETFVPDLTVLLDEFEQSVKKWEAARGGHAAARASIESNLFAALTLIGKLDIFVANQFQNDPATMAMWERIRKVELPRRVRRKGAVVAAVAEPAVATVPEVVAPSPAPAATAPVVVEPAPGADAGPKGPAYVQTTDTEWEVA